MKRPSTTFYSLIDIQRRGRRLRRRMSNSFLKQNYAIQNVKGQRVMNPSTQASEIRAIIDPRFHALINRATVSARSNQISPEVDIDISSSNTNSTVKLDSTLQKWVRLLFDPVQSFLNQSEQKTNSLTNMQAPATRIVHWLVDHSHSNSDYFGRSIDK